MKIKSLLFLSLLISGSYAFGNMCIETNNIALNAQTLNALSCHSLKDYTAIRNQIIALNHSLARLRQYFPGGFSGGPGNHNPGGFFGGPGNHNPGLGGIFGNPGSHNPGGLFGGGGSHGSLPSASMEQQIQECIKTLRGKTDSAICDRSSNPIGIANCILGIEGLNITSYYAHKFCEKAEHENITNYYQCVRVKINNNTDKRDALNQCPVKF